jgi:glycosyltransferase involved in cell wall biosynthesis
MYFLPKHPVLWIKKLCRTFLSKLFFRGGGVTQNIWKLWKSNIACLNDEYDIAVGSQEGITNYFVVDKVRAKRKILWIHSQYGQLDYVNTMDYPYFKKADAVVTISEICRQSLEDSFPEIRDKFHVLPNITNSSLIRKMSMEPIDENFFQDNICNIITVGRLAAVKGYDLAIKAAYLLKEQKFDFRWIVIGEGLERKNLEKMINEYDLVDYFKLIGLRSNPYAYISKANIAVQSSKYEGKSIFADEAKILGKVLVSTNYETVYDQIEDGKTGIIVEMTPESLADGIKRAFQDENLRNIILKNLQNIVLDNIKEINNYYKLYEAI